VECSLAGRAYICKRLRSPGIDAEESIPVAWRTGTTNRLSNRLARLGIDYWAP